MKQSVIAIVTTNESDHVILVKRRDVPVWVLPGGGIDQGETPEEAVLREVLEETGLEVKISRKTGEYTPINKLTSLTHVYECLTVGGTTQVTDETRDIKSFHVSKLPASFFFIHKEWLDDAQQNNPELIRKALSHITYWLLAKYFFRHPVLVLRAFLARLGLPFNSK